MGWEIIVIGLVELAGKAIETGVKIYDAATAPSPELKKRVTDAVARLVKIVEVTMPAEWAASDAAARAEIEKIGDPAPVVVVDVVVVTSATPSREDATKPGG